jgi:2-haloacid dehalogenase
MKFDTIVFALGGVLIDWNPRYLFRKIFKNTPEMEWFIGNVCHHEWNLQLDKGYSFSKGVEDLKLQFPEYTDQIEAYRLRWPEMLGDEIKGSVQLMKGLQDKGLQILGLTNWSMETFPFAWDKYTFLSSMDGIVVSGKEKLIKPDPAIYQLLLSRYNVQPERTVFIDDNEANIKAAMGLGFTVIHFVSPEKLAADLQALQLL